MALCGTSIMRGVECLEAAHFKGNLSTLHIKPPCTHFRGYPLPRQCPKVWLCSLGKSFAPTELKDVADKSWSVSMDEELEHVKRFRMSDFKVLDSISTGLGGRADEVVFEAIVKDPKSPLYNTKVVLRRLITAQAKRRGKRSIQYHGS